MDLLLMFFLLALLLQGIKALVNYLLNRSEDFNETILSRSSEMEYANLLSVPVPIKERGDKVYGTSSESTPTDPAYQGIKPKGKEVFMQPSFHKSA